MVVVIFVAAVIGASLISIIIIYSYFMLTYDDNYSNKIVGHMAL
jgi:hypothetical protein